MSKLQKRGYVINTAVLVVLFALFMLISGSLGGTDSFKLILVPSIWQCCYLIILAASLNLVLGFLGQLSLGHCGFMAIGAYTAALMSLAFQRAGVYDEKSGAVFIAIIFLCIIAAGLLAAVIGADTMVVCEGEIFGKPVSLSDAKRMLRCLSGRTHEVLTAVSVWMVAAPEPENISLGFRTFVDRSAVTFRELTDEEIVDYLRKGESFDKAGAYAVQGAGADLVARVDGAMDTVIGLPVGRLLEEFPDFAGSAS